MSIKPKSMLMFFKPRNIVFMVWANRFHKVPIISGVVHVNQVTYFVGNHIVDNTVGR